ncbi:MAG: ABC transporter ATP-binding protein [Dermatophilaceae bacterium]
MIGQRDMSDRVRLNDVSVTFGKRPVLRSLDLRVAEGASVSIVGPSGSGKSTMLSVILGLVRPNTGQVVVGDVDVATARSRTLTALRRSTIGVVFQANTLLPDLSPVENAVVPALLAGLNSMDARRRADELIAQLGVPTDVERTAQLSGGEQQRVAIARSLVNRPSLILADEPTANLDARTRDHCCELLFALARQERAAVVVVTHDEEVAKRADRCYSLVNGALEAIVVPA